jgi:hypothetical protein
MHNSPALGRNHADIYGYIYGYIYILHVHAVSGMPFQECIFGNIEKFVMYRQCELQFLAVISTLNTVLCKKDCK